MTAQEVIDRCHDAFILVTREGDRIGLEPLFPGEYPLTDALIDMVREYKPAVLEWLAYQEQADKLILDSTRRLGAAWPQGCPLEGPEWEAHEQALHEAYWSMDLDRLTAVLSKREAYALALFKRYRNEVNA